MSELERRTPDPSTVAMDAYVALLAEDVECAQMIKWWVARREVVQDRLKNIMGDHDIGTVNGQEAIHYERQNRFNGTAFKKKYPALHESYMIEKTERRLDPELLRISQPEIYRQFQVRSMRVTFEPPGAKQSPDEIS